MTRATSRYRRIDATSFCASTADLGPRLKTSTESSAPSTRAVDPWLFVALLRRGFGACLPRCRRPVTNCAGLATLGVGRRGGRARFAPPLLRPFRRRQHPFQCVAAHFRRQVRVPRPLGRDKRCRARDCGADGRLVLGRARGRAAEVAATKDPGALAVKGFFNASASGVSASSHRSTSAGMVRITGIAFGRMGETMALTSITRKPKSSWAASIGALAMPWRPNFIERGRLLP